MSLPETTPEDRRLHYEDLEKCLNPGFLYHQVNVGGARLVLRNPTRSDIFLVQARSKFSDDIDWKRWCVATCTWMVNGYILLDEANAAALVYDVLKHLPEKSFNPIFWALLSLRNRVTRALRGLEAYCFEGYSRQRWHSLNGANLSSETITGVPGTSRLGLNLGQQLWVIYNVIEDERLRDERQWVLLRSTMSPHLAKKSWDQLISADKSTENRRRDDRQRERDLFYYRSIGALAWDEDFTDLQGPARFKRKSVKDLQSEFYSWVAGEKDEHDLIVEDYKRKIREAHQRAHQRREERRKKVQELFGDSSGVTTRVRMLGYTAEQLANILKDQSGKRRNVAQVHDQGREEYLYDRYLKEDPSAGALAVVDGTLQMAEEAPGALQDQVANRRLAPDILKQWE